LLDVMVEGTLANPMDPVNPFNPMTRERVPAGQFPVALSAPIFIDADGDGRVDLEALPPADLLQLEEETTDPLF